MVKHGLTCMPNEVRCKISQCVDLHTLSPHWRPKKENPDDHRQEAVNLTQNKKSLTSQLDLARPVHNVAPRSPPAPTPPSPESSMLGRDARPIICSRSVTG